MDTENNSGKSEKALRIGSVSRRLISEAILNDKQLKALHSKRAKIYSIATPTAIMKDNGEIENVWIDETNHPILPEINKMIDHRIEQIKSSYSLI